MTVVTCTKCESVHFNVRWNESSNWWQICCEGCGVIFNLWPAGVLAEKLAPEKENIQ